MKKSTEKGSLKGNAEEGNSLAPVKMREVAEACNVSVVTVSRVLRGGSRHSKETCERVLKAAERLGYRPNPMVSALMSLRGKGAAASTNANLAFLCLHPGWEGHPFYQGAKVQAERLGFCIEPIYLRNGEEKSIRRQMLARGIRGILLLPAPQSGTKLAFDFSNFAAVTIGYSIEYPVLPRVVTDSFGRLWEALCKAEARGYRRIGVVSDLDLNRRFQFQYSVACEVFRRTRAGGARVFEKEFSEPLSRTRDADLLRWIKRNRLDVVISQDGNLLRVLHLAGVRVPEECAVVMMHQQEDPRWTAIDQCQLAIGRAAMDLLSGMVFRGEFFCSESPSTLSIPSRWHEGETLPWRCAKPDGSESGGSTGLPSLL